jgi:hypothetical protein
MGIIMKKWLPVIVLLGVSLLAACNPGTGNIIGRWEYFTNDDHSAGAVYEFMEDDTCLYYEFGSASELLYPALMEQNVARYITTSDSLVISQRRGHYYGSATETETETDPESKFALTFISEDELQLVPDGQTDGRTFHRAALSEMSLDARLLLGKNLQRGGMTVVSAERLVGDWQAAYPGYMESGRDYYVEKIDPEQWAVVVQLEGRPDNVIFILVEGESWWGLIRLEKAE